MTRDNPFPGMNPFLEGFWSDVHTGLMVYISDALAGQLPSGFKARCHEHLVGEDEITERWVNVLDSHSNVVTVIEVLSPTNKGSGQGKYQAKRETNLQSGVNVVEIDLLRGGHDAVAIPCAARDPKAPYIVCVTRATNPVQKEYYQTRLTSVLPNVRIPLRAEDRDVVLPLQQLVDRCYRMGAYWNENHENLPSPPLDDEDAAWVTERLKAAGLV